MCDELEWIDRGIRGDRGPYILEFEYTEPALRLVFIAPDASLARPTAPPTGYPPPWASDCEQGYENRGQLEKRNKLLGKMKQNGGAVVCCCSLRTVGGISAARPASAPLGKVPNATRRIRTRWCYGAMVCVFTANR